MADNYYRMAVIGMFAIIIFGGYMAFNGYYKDVYPLDLSRGLLDRIAGGNEPLLMIDDLRKIKTLLPPDGNPVWIFPTDTTNFERLQKDMDTMIESVESVKNEPANSEAFNAAMFDIHFRAIQLRQNLMDATPYMYASFSNIVFTSIWIAAILGVFAMLKRKKEHLKSYDKADDV